MDCIILAGNKESYRRVTALDNKAFLPIDDQNILNLMLIQIAEVPEVERVLIVGPAKRLEEEIAPLRQSGYPKPLLIFEQKNDLVANAVSVVDATSEGQPEDRYVLILPSDIPVLVSEELREFIALCDMDRYDYITGLVTEEVMQAYYPQGDKPGVQMAYLYAGKHGYRPNNLHMVRPSKLGRLQYVRQTYSVRYQKKWINILIAAKTLLGMIRHLPGSVFIYLFFQAARLSHAYGLTRLGHWIQNRLKLETAERYGSRILDTRFKLVITHFGGAAVDVDNESDYFAIRARWREWIQLQKEVDSPRRVTTETGTVSGIPS